MGKYSIIEGDISQTLTGQEGNGQLFDACLSDPPYGFTAFTHARKTQAWEREDVPDVSVWEMIYDRLKPGSFLVAASGARLYHRMAYHIEEAEFQILDPFLWLYSGANCTGVLEGQRLRPSTEPYVVAWKPGAPASGRMATDSYRAPDGGLPVNVGMDSLLAAALEHQDNPIRGAFVCGKAPPSERIKGDDHPTHKPLALCQHLARLLLTQKRKRLLVPFSGVGSEMIGALRAGWSEVVGLEREAKYVRVAHKRIAKFAPGSTQIQAEIRKRAA